MRRYPNRDQNNSSQIYECFGNVDPRYANRKRTGLYTQDNQYSVNNIIRTYDRTPASQTTDYSSPNSHISQYSNRFSHNDNYLQSSNFGQYNSLSSQNDEYSPRKSYRSTRLTSSQGINIKGIRNICNTCFINSALQVLLNLPQFMSDMINSLEQINKQFGSASFIQEICLIFYRYISSQKGYIQINKFYDILREKIPYLGDGGQHDVAEFFQLLAESCENEILSFISASDRKTGEILLSKSLMLSYDPFMKNFGFSVITNVVCERCGYALTEEVQTNFILHLPFVSRRLEECLSKSFAKERIETTSKTDYNSYSYSYRYRRTTTSESKSSGYCCKKCQNNSAFSLCTSLYRIPRFLIIQIARFDSTLTKNSSPINVPDRIDLQQYINDKYFASPDPIRVRSRDDIDIEPLRNIDSDDDGGLYSYQKTTRRKNQESVDSPTVSEDEQLKRKIGYPNASYSLVSIILHEGSFSAGHYTAAINSQRSGGEWTVVSDDIVMDDARISPSLPYCFIYQID